MDARVQKFEQINFCTLRNCLNMVSETFPVTFSNHINRLACIPQVQSIKQYRTTSQTFVAVMQKDHNLSILLKNNESLLRNTNCVAVRRFLESSKRLFDSYKNRVEIYLFCRLEQSILLSPWSTKN